MLRRTARAPAGARVSGAARPVSHLDADELAAFTEGALPEAARADAVSHLAECAECRALAVNLTRAAGVEAELEKRAAASAAASASPARESKSSRGWLASLFAPRTLRYVAPALALCLVAAVSFIALRSGRPQLESNRAASDTRAPVTQDSSPQQMSEGITSSSATANANAAPTAPAADAGTHNKAAADTTAPRQQDKDAEAGAAAGASASSSVDSAASEPAPSKSAEVDAMPPPPPPASKKEDVPAGAAPEDVSKLRAENLPAPKSGGSMKTGPTPSTTNDEVASNESLQQRRAQQPRNLEPQAPDGARNNQSRSAANNVSGGGALAGSARDDRDARREGASRRGRTAQDAQGESERANSAEESRSVAGHRFRREGGAWVDVNYKSSMASTGVRRGTDSYRALVADIPEVGRVAEQLGGEVIVVVRGRAYRVR
jgi:hypothetical protein